MNSSPFSSLHHILDMLNTSFNALKCDIPSQELEQMGTLILEAMSTRNRSFHDANHLFHMGLCSEPIQTLAILFHDIVYWQVDRARHRQIKALMKPFDPNKKNSEGEIEFLSDGPPLSMKIFGIQESTKLNIYNGMNEFLSACVAEKTLKPYLTTWDLIQVLAGIELTIPFRGKDTITGLYPAQRIYRRLEALCKEYDLKKNQSEMTAALRSIVTVANRDVEGFALIDTASFLDGTWKLLWESNPPLQTETYLVSEYRQALSKMEKFLSGLSPDVIFTSHPVVSNDTEINSLRMRAKKNLEITVECLRAKLLAVSIIEAIAALSGGDSQLMLFLPTLKIFDMGSGLTDRQQLIVQLLKQGLTNKLLLDHKESQFAAFLFCQFSETEFQQAISLMRDFFSAKCSQQEYLTHPILSKRVLTFLPLLSETAWTRSMAVQSILVDLSRN